MLNSTTYSKRFWQLLATGISRQAINALTVIIIATKFGLEVLAGFSAIQILLLVFIAIADCGLRNYYCQLFDENSNLNSADVIRMLLIKSLTSTAWIPVYILSVYIFFDQVRLSFTILSACLVFNPLLIEWLMRLRGDFVFTGATSTLNAALFLFFVVALPEPNLNISSVVDKLIIGYTACQLILFLPLATAIFIRQLKQNSLALNLRSFQKGLRADIRSAQKFWLSMLLTRTAPNISFLAVAASSASYTMIGEFRLYHVVISLIAASSLYLTSPAFNKIGRDHAVQVCLAEKTFYRAIFGLVTIGCTLIVLGPYVAVLLQASLHLKGPLIALLLIHCLLHLCNACIREIGPMIFPKRYFFAPQLIFLLAHGLMPSLIKGNSSVLVPSLFLISLEALLLLTYARKLHISKNAGTILFRIGIPEGN